MMIAASPRQKAILWSRKAMRSKDIVIMDTETTGLTGNDRVCEISIIETGGEVLFDCLMDPLCPISEGASKVNGLLDFDVSGKDTMVVHFDRLRRILFSKYLVGWNVGFDKRLLEQSWKALDPRAQLPIVGQWIDLMKVYADFSGQSRCSLSAAAKECGIDGVQSHRALGDCEWTLGVIRHMAEVPDEVQPERKLVLDNDTGLYKAQKQVAGQPSLFY